MTLPDQSYTVKELFHRFRKGLPMTDRTREPIYADDSNEVDLEKVANMSKMDKADLSAELARQHDATITQLEQDKEQRDADALAKKVAEENALKNAGEPGKA